MREARLAFTFDRADQSWPAFRMMLQGAGKPLYRSFWRICPIMWPHGGAMT
ncbi:MAG: hypothetical protein ACREBK_05050 [Sphingomicrobium sp.]